METEPTLFDRVVNGEVSAIGVPALVRQDAVSSANPPDSKSSGRCWCLTIPNYTDTEYDSLLVYFASDKVRYGIVGKELGSTGFPHLQVYLVYHNSVRFSAVKKVFPRAHIEKAKGTAEQNIEYCKKEGNFKEIGDAPSTGMVVFCNSFDCYSDCLYCRISIERYALCN